MRNIKLLLLLTLFVSVAGCKKDDTLESIPKIKTYSLDIGGGAFGYAYTYFDDGRRASEVDDAGNVVNYTYGANTFFTTDGNGDTLTVYTLNSKGYVISAKSGGDITTYTYDSEGHKTSENIYIEYTWANGNRATAGNGAITFSYLTDKTNTIGNENNGQRYFGVDSKNLVSIIDFGVSTTNYSYVYDSKGRVTVRTAGSETETYTYY